MNMLVPAVVSIMALTCGLEAQPSALPFQVTVVGEKDTAIEVRVQGDVSIREQLMPEKSTFDTAVLLSRETAMRFAKHLIWTWREGDLQAYIENWQGGERESQRTVFNATNFQRNREIARRTIRWVARGSIAIGGYVALFIERFSDEGGSALSTIVLTQCGERLCQTNELAKDPIGAPVLEKVRASIAVERVR